MTRFIVLIAMTLISQATLVSASSAETPSPLDRPIEAIKQDIASVVHCRWWIVSKQHQSCTDQDEKRGDWIQLEISADGKIDHINFDPLIVEPIRVDRERDETIFGKTRRARETQAITIAAIQKLWPAWATSSSWLKSAFKNARKKHFQNSVRVGGTSVYVTETGPVDSDDRFAFLVLTKKADLTEFKYSPCEDDKQGPGMDNCTDRNGAPRPPNNSVLHPK